MWVPFYHYTLQYYFVCKFVQRKKHSKGNTARAQDQEACSFNSVTNPLWLISISCYMYLTIARPIPLEIPWVCPALRTSFEWSLDCSPWKFQEPSYLLGGFYSKRQSALMAITLLPSVQLFPWTPLCPPALSKAWEAASAQILPQAGTRSCPQRTLSGAFSSAQLDTSSCVSKQDKNEIFTFCFCSNPFLYPS